MPALVPFTLFESLTALTQGPVTQAALWLWQFSGISHMSKNLSLLGLDLTQVLPLLYPSLLSSPGKRYLAGSS